MYDFGMQEAEHHVLPGWWPNDLSPNKIETWKEYGRWFAKLVYQGEHNDIKYRLTIPKLCLGNFFLQDLYTAEHCLTHRAYSYADFYRLGLLDLYRDDHDQVFYLEINQETHEMTIEQIEAKLGYKVKIVED